MLRYLLVFSALCSICLACLITNCPRGGKRGEIVPRVDNVIRECTSCGPNRMGQCFGPQICCGLSTGCFFGTAEAYRCKGESLHSKPCTAGFAMCRGGTGRCAANGICCTQESCHSDSSCRLTEPLKDRDFNDELGSFLSDSNSIGERI